MGMGVGVGVGADERGGHGGGAQDSSLQRGGVKDPQRGPGPILDAAPQAGEAWAEPSLAGGRSPPRAGGYSIATFKPASSSRSTSSRQRRSSSCSASRN